MTATTREKVDAAFEKDAGCSIEGWTITATT